MHPPIFSVLLILILILSVYLLGTRLTHQTKTPVERKRESFTTNVDPDDAIDERKSELAEQRPLDVNHVIDHVYIGSVDGAFHLPVLEQNGFTCIVDLSNLASVPRSAQINYMIIPVDDSPNTDLSRYFQEASAFIDQCAASSGKVLVHCMAGISRSATIVLAYLMLRKQMSLKDALGLLMSQRPWVKPNAGFIRQLQRLDQMSTR